MALPQSRNAYEVIAALENLLSESVGDYVRLIAIDPQSKRRVSEQIIQRPPGSPTPMAQRTTTSTRPTTATPVSASPVGQLVRQWLSQGYRVGAEVADTRRFKTSSWLSVALPSNGQEGTSRRRLKTCCKKRRASMCGSSPLTPNPGGG